MEDCFLREESGVISIPVFRTTVPASLNDVAKLPVLSP